MNEWQYRHKDIITDLHILGPTQNCNHCLPLRTVLCLSVSAFSLSPWLSLLLVKTSRRNEELQETHRNIETHMLANRNFILKGKVNTNVLPQYLSKRSIG